MNPNNFFHNMTEQTVYTFADVLTFIHHRFVITPSPYTVWSKSNTIAENQNSLAVLVYAQHMNYTIEQSLCLYAEHYLQCLAQPQIKKHRNIFQLHKIYRKLIQNNYHHEITINDITQPLQHWPLKATQFIELPAQLITQV
jgi:hypothetical protein